MTGVVVNNVAKNAKKPDSMHASVGFLRPIRAHHYFNIASAVSQQYSYFRNAFYLLTSYLHFPSRDLLHHLQEQARDDRFLFLATYANDFRWLFIERVGDRAPRSACSSSPLATKITMTDNHDTNK